MKRILTALALAVAASAGLATPAQSAPPPIVGGHDATVNPGVVSIYTDAPYRNRCNGVLIAPTWVISAAHCEEILPIAETELRIGSLDNTVGYFSAGVAAFYAHPDYDPQSLERDLMLIELDRPVPSKVQKPAGWDVTPLPVGTPGWIAGWGWVCETDPSCATWYAGPLQALDVTVLPDADCASLWFPDTELCFESRDGSHAMACAGDSGTGVFTNGLGGGSLVRAIVIYDGDTWGAGDCASAPDGSNGLGVAMEIDRPWVASVMAQ